MEQNILIVSSVTYAIKAKNELLREGINCKVEKLKKVQTLKGCGYGVAIARDNTDYAVDVMKRANIKVIEIVPYHTEAT